MQTVAKTSNQALTGALPKALELLATEVLEKIAALSNEWSNKYQQEYPELRAKHDVDLAAYQGRTVLRTLRLVSEPKAPIPPDSYVPRLHLYRDVTPLYPRDFQQTVLGVLKSLEKQGLIRFHDHAHISSGGPDYYISVTEEGRAAVKQASQGAA
jgi:hypothetical protein